MSAGDSTNRWKYRIRKLLLILFLLIPLWSYLAWLASPSTSLRVVMLDKTAQDFSNIEHRAFTWVLNYNKYTKDNGELYNRRIDYLGYFPSPQNLLKKNDLEGANQRLIDSISDHVDVGYFIDTYGSYYEDWKDRIKDIPEKGMIYGGLESEDVSLLQSLRDRDKLILAEFSIFGNPTPKNIRFRAEELLGVHFSGWVGRYFAELDTNLNPEIPRWIPRLYNEQYNEEYHFSGPGIGFFHENGHLLILDKDELVHDLPIIETEEDLADQLGVDAFIRYPFWFEICNQDTSTRTVSQYRIYASNTGATKMRALGIPQSFPAVIAHPNWHIIYMAGDFTDNPIGMYTSHFKGISSLDMLWYDNRNPSDRRKFFWDYYNPFISGVLDRYLDEIRNNTPNPISLPERSGYATLEKLLVNFEAPKVNWSNLPNPFPPTIVDTLLQSDSTVTDSTLTTENSSSEDSMPLPPIKMIEPEPMPAIFFGSFARMADARRFIQNHHIPYVKPQLNPSTGAFDVVLRCKTVEIAREYERAVEERYPQSRLIYLSL